MLTWLVRVLRVQIIISINIVNALYTSTFSPVTLFSHIFQKLKPAGQFIFFPERKMSCVVGFTIFLNFKGLKKCCTSLMNVYGSSRAFIAYTEDAGVPLIMFLCTRHIAFTFVSTTKKIPLFLHPPALKVF